jgi:hypothetical protein
MATERERETEGEGEAEGEGEEGREKTEDMMEVDEKGEGRPHASTLSPSSRGIAVRRVAAEWDAVRVAVTQFQMSFHSTPQPLTKKVAESLRDEVASLHSLLIALAAEDEEAFALLLPVTSAPHPLPPDPTTSARGVRELRTSSGTDLVSLFKDVNVATQGGVTAHTFTSRTPPTAFARSSLSLSLSLSFYLSLSISQVFLCLAFYLSLSLFRSFSLTVKILIQPRCQSQHWVTSWSN